MPGLQQYSPQRQAAFGAEGRRRRGLLGIPQAPMVDYGPQAGLPPATMPQFNMTPTPGVDPYAQQRQAAMQPTRWGSGAAPMSPQLSLRSLAASRGIPMNPGVPLEQQGFAAHQGVNSMGLQGGLVQGGGPMYGQQAGDGGQPQDQYGLRRALGTGNIDRSVASAPAGVLGQNIPQPDFQVLGVLPGGAEVSQDMGRHIVRGNAPPNSQNATLQAYTKKNYEARKLADNQKRYESALRKPGQKLSDSYLRNKFNIPADAPVGAPVGATPKPQGMTLADRGVYLSKGKDEKDVPIQQKHRDTIGFSPAEDTPDVILSKAIDALSAIDPNDKDGRNLIIGGINAAKSRPNFTNSYGGVPNYYYPQLQELEELVKDPDAYLAKRKEKKPLQIPRPKAQSTSTPPAFGYTPPTSGGLSRRGVQQ